MTVARRKVKDTRKRILRTAEDLVTQRIAENSVEELTRVGIVWCGLLDLDEVISPSDVAAMLSAYDLIRATNLVDSEEYWTSAAAYAALGAYSEPYGKQQTVEIYDENANEKEDKSSPIGFAPGHSKSSN
jgi:hypothetical protein